MIYYQLFLSFFKVGLFAIGGAYSFLPLLEKEVVERQGWLSPGEFLDISGLVKIFPGAISIKYATYTGYKMAGWLGVLIANFANLLAPAALVIGAGLFYQKFKTGPRLKGAFSAIQLVVFAMIIAAAFQTVDLDSLRRAWSLLVVVAAFTLFMFTRLEPALIILAAGFLGALFLSKG